MIDMGLLRRNSTQQIRDSTATDSDSDSDDGKLDPSQQLNPPLPASLGSAALSRAQSLLLWPVRMVAMAESYAKGATKMSSWKKLLIQLGVCFVMGFLLGWVVPQKWQLFVPDSLAVGSGTAEADLFGGFGVANAVMESKTASRLGSKARDVISVDEFSGGNTFCHVLRLLQHCP